MQVLEEPKGWTIVINASHAQDLNKFYGETVFGVCQDGSVGVITRGHMTALKADDDVQQLINGMLAALNLQEAR